MCVCGWQLAGVTVLLAVSIIVYGEMEGRRRSEIDRRALRRRLVEATLTERRPAAQARTGNPRQHGDPIARRPPSPPTHPGPADPPGPAGGPPDPPRRRPPHPCCSLPPPEQPPARQDRSPYPDRTRFPPHPAPGAHRRRVPVSRPTTPIEGRDK